MKKTNRIRIIIQNRQKKIRIGRFERGSIENAAGEAFALASAAAFSAVTPGRRRYYEVTVLLTDDAGIKDANHAYRGIGGATDVLSFPYGAPGGGIDFMEPAAGRNVHINNEKNRNVHIKDKNRRSAYICDRKKRLQLGEIMISAERAFSQAEEYGHGFLRELAFLAAHGALHVLGYDHGGGDGPEMDRLTELALQNAGLPREPSGCKDPQRASAGCASPAHTDVKPDLAAANRLAPGAVAPEGFRSGFISVAGKPNVGKSTLINTVCGNPLTIVSNKPQTTRRNVRVILTAPGYQIVFEDTPGLHEPKNRFAEYMVRRAKASVSETDAVLLVTDARDGRLSPQDEDVLRIVGSRGSAPQNPEIGRAHV
jgi:rRNA maturation RNase YbeY